MTDKKLDSRPDAKKTDSRSAATAAAIILLVSGTILYLMPNMILWLGDFSPWLATAFGICVILCFFLVFWLRARYQRNKRL